MDVKSGVGSVRRAENEKRARMGPHAFSLVLFAEPYVVEVPIAC
jgi:hypothetical protein